MSVDASSTSPSVGLFFVCAADDPDLGDPLWAANASEALLRGSQWLGLPEAKLYARELLSAAQADLFRSSIETLIERHGASGSARLILELVGASMVQTVLERGRENVPVQPDIKDHE